MSLLNEAATETVIFINSHSFFIGYMSAYSWKTIGCDMNLRLSHDGRSGNRMIRLYDFAVSIHLRAWAGCGFSSVAAITRGRASEDMDT